MAYHSGLDIGTSETKALSIAEAGQPASSYTQEYPLR